MKKTPFSLPWIFLPIILILVSFPKFSLAQTVFTTENPVEYSNFIVKEQEKVGLQFLEFSVLLVNSKDSPENEKKRVEVVQEIELGLRRLRNMAPFKGSDNLRNESIAVFELYRKLHTEEYAKLAVLVANKESSLEKLAHYFALQVAAEKKMRKNASRLHEAQEKFAKANRLTLRHNSMQKQFDRILATNIYSREVFLGYISVAKVNEAWWDAMQKDDFVMMEKQCLLLQDAVKNSVLYTQTDLNGNTKFRDIARKRIEWYGELAKNEYKSVRKILMNTQRSEEDVDFVNEMIAGYNSKNAAQNEEFNIAARELKANALKKQE